MHIGSDAGTLIYGEFDNHKVGINTTTPRAPLQVVGNFIAGADTNAISSSTSSSIAGGSGNTIDGNYAFI